MKRALLTAALVLGLAACANAQQTVRLWAYRGPENWQSLGAKQYESKLCHRLVVELLPDAQVRDNYVTLVCLPSSYDPTSVTGWSRPVVLYRNSVVADTPEVRLTYIHLAKFNADESNPTFNLQNCAATASILNKNAKHFMENVATGATPVFWCELQ